MDNKGRHDGIFKMSEPFNLKAFELEELHRRRQLVQVGLLLPASNMCRRLGVALQALESAVTARCMFTVDVDNEKYFPAFYLLTNTDRRKLEEVTRLLGELPDWSKWQFFTTPKASLNGMTPLEALERGMVEEVMDAAEAFAGP